jgi:pimeloyl-ACP methyl ester carboxylesterase
MFPSPKIIQVDGRQLAIEDSGIGFPILVQSGFGSRHLFPAALLDAERAGFRLISYDRPGLGQSSPQPDRQVADSIEDVRAIADSLEIDRIAVWGSSGGGPYAVAAAAGLSDIVTSVCLFSPIGPYGTPLLDFTEGMGVDDDFRSEIAKLLEDPSTARVGFMAQANDMLESQGSPDTWLSRWGDLAGKDDAHSVEWAEYLAACAIDGFGESGEGWWEDWCATFLPWGVDLSQVTAPVSLWHGIKDEMVPQMHAHWYAANLSNIELHLVPDIDHTNIDENLRSTALEWFAQYAT